MNIYTYVAASNPYLVRSLAHKYGHELNNNPNLSKVLEQLVALHGEQALVDVIENHPDKELFRDYFKKNEEVKMNASGEYSQKPVPCPCESKLKESTEYLNLTGAEMIQKSKDSLTSTNLMVLAGAIVIAFAILNLKN